MTRALPKLAFALVLTGAPGAGSSSVAAQAAKCVPDPNPICYQIFAPVTCSNGVTYTNQCYADAACAKGCHPA
ncbi:MAG TPA: hypothetical protein VIA62_25755 [Thermoanaerobaculia bacterium]|nr:hypothetical protein [Thermoanaerobaculia bacterium]